MRRHAISLICLPILIVACHSGNRSAQFGGTTISHDDASGVTTISGNGASISAVSADAAQKIVLPDYAPSYPGSTIVSALNTSDGKKQVRLIRMDTLEPGATVLPFYRKALTGHGYKIDEDVQLPGGGMMTGTSGPRSASIIVSAQDGGTAIVLSITNG